MDFDIAGGLRIVYFAFFKYLRNSGIKWSNASTRYRLRSGQRSCITLSSSLVPYNTSKVNKNVLVIHLSERDVSY